MSNTFLLPEICFMVSPYADGFVKGSCIVSSFEYACKYILKYFCLCMC